MKKLSRLLPILFFSAATAITGIAQDAQQNITITIKPSQSVEERVADSMKEKELREAAEDRLAAAKSARIASKNPRSLLAAARTVYVSSSTTFFTPVQLQNALRKRAEFDAWGMAIIDRFDKANIADILIEINRPLFTYIFTYKVTDRNTGILLASGKLTAFDSNIAAPGLARRFIEDIKKARGEVK